MRTSCLRVAAIAMMFLASRPAYADQRAEENAESVRFAKLVAAGDQARRSHRISEAFKTYNNALDIRRDPAVEGRLGLLFFEISDFAAAAEHLLRAITKGQAPPYLMKQFHDTFARVRPKVCFVEVHISEQGAEVLIDGKPEPISDHNAWHVFIIAGSHTFVAKREGFEDATATIDIPAGGELEVRLNLKPLPPPPPVQVAPMPNWGPDPSLTDKPANVVKPHKRLSDSYLHFSLGAGPVLVLGAAPSVAVGAQTNVGLRRGFFSLNLEGRLAWPVGGLEAHRDLGLISWALGIRPCMHFSFVFGCGALQVDGLDGVSDGFVSKTRYGGGGRAGLEVVLRKPIRLQVWAEAIIRSKAHEVIVDGKGLSIGSPVLGAFGVTTFLTF